APRTRQINLEFSLHHLRIRRRLAATFLAECATRQPGRTSAAICGCSAGMASASVLPTDRTRGITRKCGLITALDSQTTTALSTLTGTWLRQLVPRPLAVGAL